MSLNLYLRKSGVWHIRGTVQQLRFDQSSRTRVRAEAEAIKAHLEAEAFKRAIYGDKAVATFAEAADGYMASGGSTDHLTPLLLRIGTMRLAEVRQPVVDKLAREMKPRAKPSTVVRQIYTPISAVLNYAAEQGLCDPVRLRKPKVDAGRVDYLTPEEAEILLKFLPAHLKPLVTFYLATGCRATEALDLDWRDVSVKGERVVFWETKAGYARGVNLQRRARELLPERSADLVWRNKSGEPWHAYDALNLMLKRYCARHSPTGEPVKASDPGPRFRPVHCHLFRHTWATWAYACTRDTTYLMGQGGWKSVTMVMRYAHAASPDLADAVLAAGWEFDGREIRRLPAKPSRARRSA